jgi:hypothetical protein
MTSPVDAQEYTYLLCDYEITEPYAQAKLDNGTWRNRSSEVGQYSTNNEVELWPCFMGFAFVDIPAVEGLNFESSNSGNRFFCVDFGGTNTSKETPVADEPGMLPVLPFSSPAAPAAQTPAAPPVAPAAQATAFVFSCNGTRTSDASVVQTYINQLETAMTEQRQVMRASFVSSLVAANKIPAPQTDEFTKHAMSLNDDQYAFWCKQMGGADSLSLLSNHSVGASQTASGQTASTPQVELPTQALRDAQEIVKMHQRGGRNADFIKQTNSYQALAAAGIAVQL